MSYGYVQVHNGSEYSSSGSEYSYAPSYGSSTRTPSPGDYRGSNNDSKLTNVKSTNNNVTFNHYQKHYDDAPHASYDHAKTYQNKRNTK